MKEEIFIDGQLCAIVLGADYDKSGIQFFTSNELSQQLASMSYKPGKIIPAHTHQPVRREVLYTQEALFIRKGKIAGRLLLGRARISPESHPSDR